MANEQRLVDANYLKNKMIPNCPIEDGGIPLRDFDTHQKILELYPTVDAVGVVRCGKCKHFAETKGKDSGKPCGYGRCMKPFFIAMIVDANDFCSYGERREE